MTSEERLEELRKHYRKLVDQNSEMRSELKRRREESREMQDEIDRTKRRNESLQSPAFYVATVQETTERDGSPAAIVKQHGNNQEILTEVPKNVAGKLEAGDRVTVDDSYTVKSILDGETDARAQAMEVSSQPSVDFGDIGGLEDEIREVREAVEQPLDSTVDFEEVGIEPPSGVLLYGPPGTGKTLMAKAVAQQVDATFIRLAASELVQKFIGEGARLVRDLFDLAEERAPAVIFIDEIDAIASERTVGKTNGDQEVQRTLMQLLSSMDGFDDRGDICVMAATNRFDMLDDAILRPGRFDRRIEVGTPSVEAREEILRIHTREMNVTDEIDYANLVSDLEDFTGADLEHVATEAGMCAVRDGRSQVRQSDFDDAVERVREDVEADEVIGPRYAH